MVPAASTSSAARSTVGRQGRTPAATVMLPRSEAGSPVPDSKRGQAALGPRAFWERARFRGRLAFHFSSWFHAAFDYLYGVALVLVALIVAIELRQVINPPSAGPFFIATALMARQASLGPTLLVAVLST